MNTEILFFIDNRLEQTIAENLYRYAQYAIAYTDGERVVSLHEQFVPDHLSAHIHWSKEKNVKLTPIVMPQQLVNEYRDAAEETMHALFAGRAS